MRFGGGGRGGENGEGMGGGMGGGMVGWWNYNVPVPACFSVNFVN